jgi:(E)-4-hydroxy-3-methylbut-2-enyl-diphosphate synthase
MINSGCEIVRLTAPSIRDAKNLYNIKNGLIQKGYNTPLVADIHFTPNAAIEAAKIVEKVRINPGNFSDKKKFKTYNYSKSEYLDELKRIEEKFFPLIDVCKNHKTAMRIGTNHGSLSDRILSQYGDTPLGMVESALEFVRICEKFNYSQIILSMKASNPIIMIQAYRLLVHEMMRENMNYPIHLGVTEAGEGDDARIKSGMGIGSLLLDGIGDTIRVSLTEPPEKEIPVAKALIDYVSEKHQHPKVLGYTTNPINPFTYSRFKSFSKLNIGSNHPPIVVADFSFKKEISHTSFTSIGYNYSVKLDKWDISDLACDYVFVGDSDFDFDVPGTIGIIYPYNKWISHQKGYPLISLSDYLDGDVFSKKLNFLQLCLSELSEELIVKLKTSFNTIVIISTDNINSRAEQRRLFMELMNNKVNNPVIIHRHYNNLSKESLQMNASIEIGSLLLDGLGDGVFISAENCCSDSEVNKIAFDILQGARIRISKTEYISCPSCGRTQFDLEETTQKIREKTAHLKGLKIGIMGCIVNGPGEMADADYGYVGTGYNKVSLYKQKTLVKKNIDTKDALNELIQLIQDNGDWVDGA